MLLYALGLGSPTHPLPETSYSAWCSTYKWERTYGQEYLYAGPLFTHQLSHIWIDFRGIQDGFMRDKGIDYFENSRRATYVQQQYAIDNPLKFESAIAGESAPAKVRAQRPCVSTASSGRSWITWGEAYHTDRTMAPSHRGP